MASLYSEIWLLTSAVFAVQAAVTRGQFCSSDWTFHAVTRSCIKLVRLEYIYFHAKQYCANNAGSSTTNTQGHLVFIFDKATDDFVKGLLNKYNVDSALIGLNDRAQNGVYSWGEKNGITPTYTGWFNSIQKHDLGKKAVIITKDGWKEYSDTSYAYFVCQVKVDFPIPVMQCPVAEEGQKSPDFSCTVNSTSLFTITSVNFENRASVMASCNVDSCLSHPGYLATPLRGTRRSLSWNLKVINVRRSDETDWTCYVQFNNITTWVASSPCSLKVYTKPTEIQCSHSLVQSTIKASCTVARVFTEVGCSCTVKSGWLEPRIYNTAIENGKIASGNTYFNATCNAMINITNGGRYEISVSVFPTGQEFKPLQTQLATVRNFTVPVELPKLPPELYLGEKAIEPSWLEMVENQTLRLTCRVPGGDPSVYRTIISCDYPPQRYAYPPQSYESEGNSTTMDVRITREFHGKKCTCSAVHAAPYTLTSGVEIRVKYPAKISDFSISPRYDTIKRGDTVSFSCTAGGNPAPELILHRQYGLTVTNSSTGSIKYNLTVVCSDMGRYVCAAKNTLDGQLHLDSKDAQLQVRCPPELCGGMSNVSLPAAIGSAGASIKICVHAYPAPTSFSLYKGSRWLNHLKFKAVFSFTSEEDGQGEITLLISPFAQEDTGDYQLYSSIRNPDLYSYLSFRVFAQGPPSCPTNFTVAGVGPDSVTLSWTPGFDGGLKQTFMILRVDDPSSTASSSTDSLVLGRVEDQGEDSVFKVTGLSASTTYTFGLEVRNEKGTENCLHLQANVTTSAASSAALVDGDTVTAIVAPVVAVVFLLILVAVVVVVVLRRRRGSLHDKPIKAENIVRSGAGEISGVALNESNPETVYANSANKDVKKAKKGEKPPRKTKEDLDNNPVYAQINQQNKKAKKKQNNENSHKDVAEVYQNVPKANVNQSCGAKDVENVYANARLPDKGESPLETHNSRTVTQEGLVYVSVQINKSTTYPEIVPAKKPAKMAQPEHENVEYIAINFSPAAKQK